MWTSGLYPCQRKMNSSQQCYDSHLSHIKRWTARFCLNSHFLVAFSYLSRIQIVLILFSFHVPDTSQAHACQNPEGRRLQMKEGKRTWHWGMVPSMSKGVGKGTASQSHRRSHLNSTSGLSSVAGPRTNLGHTGPTLGLFQSLFSRILLLSLKPSPPTSKILKATSLEFLLSSIHKVSNICWHQLCARNSAEHGISAVIQTALSLPARTTGFGQLILKAAAGAWAPHTHCFGFPPNASLGHIPEATTSLPQCSSSGSVPTSTLPHHPVCE